MNKTFNSLKVGDTFLVNDDANPWISKANGRCKKVSSQACSYERQGKRQKVRVLPSIKFDFEVFDVVQKS